MFYLSQQAFKIDLKDPLEVGDLYNECDTDSQPYTPKKKYDELTPSKEIFLDQLLLALEQINSNLHKMLSRYECFMVLSWVLGIYAHVQNKLQQDQIIELAHFLKLTMVQVGEHQEFLYELDTRLLILNKTLFMFTKQTISYPMCTVTVLTDVHMGITYLTSSILILKGNVDALHEYIRVLASHNVMPLTVPPLDLHNILVKIKHEDQQ